MNHRNLIKFHQQELLYSINHTRETNIHNRKVLPFTLRFLEIEECLWNTQCGKHFILHIFYVLHLHLAISSLKGFNRIRSILSSYWNKIVTCNIKEVSTKVYLSCCGVNNRRSLEIVCNLLYICLNVCIINTPNKNFVHSTLYRFIQTPYKHSVLHHRPHSPRSPRFV